MFTKVWKVKIDYYHHDEVIQYFKNASDAVKWMEITLPVYRRYHPCTDDELYVSIKRTWVLDKKLTLWNYSPNCYWGD